MNEHDARLYGVNDAVDRRCFLVRTTGILASLSLAGVGLGACGSSSPSSQPPPAARPSRPTGTLRVANGAAPASLDPAQAAGIGEFLLLRNLHDGLLNFDASYRKLAPALATEWSVSDDGREWEFRLRSGAKFHDGEPVDSTAVKKTFEYYLESEGSFGQLLLPQFREIDDSDPVRARIVLKDPYADLATNQTVVRLLSPRSIAAGRESVGAKPAGAGPFRFVSRAQDGSLVLEAFTEYWGDAPFVERLELPVIADLSAQVSALEAGDVDLVTGLPPLQGQRVARSRDTETSAVESWGVSYLVFRCDQPPVDDLRVRQAICHAIDRDAIRKSVLVERGSVLDSVYPPGLSGYSEPSTTYPYDPERARELVRESGATAPVRLRMAAPPEDSQVPQAIVGQLKDAGFDATLTVLEAGVFGKEFGSARPRFQLFKNQHFWLTGGPLFFSIGLFPILSHYSDARLDSLTGKLVSMPAGAQREQTLAEIQEAFARGVPYFPLHTIESTDAFKSNVYGYEAPKDGLMPSLGGAYLASEG